MPLQNMGLKSSRQRFVVATWEAEFTIDDAVVYECLADFPLFRTAPSLGLNLHKLSMRPWGRLARRSAVLSAGFLWGTSARTRACGVAR